MKNIQAILLLSGGLDSTLAVKLMLEQGITISALNFVTPFCTCTKKGCKSAARTISKSFDIPLRTIAGGSEYIQMIKNPRHGYGKNMNPCIDCRILIFSKARSIMEETGAKFIVTGEVLGERPMSQRRHAMQIIEKESGLEGRILRPLSAKFFKPTTAEDKGWIDREKLLAIQGRSRKPQIALARKFHIEDYPCPAGGCRLTDPQFANRLRDGFNHSEDTLQDIRLLKYGRHFRLSTNAKVIVGRNEKDNQFLKELAPATSLILECAETMAGPTTVLLKSQKKKDIATAGGITLRYSDYSEAKGRVKVWENRSQEGYVIQVNQVNENVLSHHRI